MITSCFREPTTFPVLFDVPEGQQLTGVKELLNDESVSHSVEMGFDTPAKLFLFQLS